MVCDAAFVIFSTTWVYTRLAVFPAWICYSTIVEAGQVIIIFVIIIICSFLFQLIQMFPVYYIFNFLMTTLLMLHTMWFYFIIKVALKVMMNSGVAEDARSESDDSDDVNEESWSESDTEKKN